MNTPPDFCRISGPDARVLIAAPGVIHEQIESPLFGTDPLEECFDAVIGRVIATDGRPDAATCYHFLLESPDLALERERLHLSDGIGTESVRGR